MNVRAQRDGGRRYCSVEIVIRQVEMAEGGNAAKTRGECTGDIEISEVDGNDVVGGGVIIISSSTSNASPIAWSVAS